MKEITDPIHLENVAPSRKKLVDPKSPHYNSDFDGVNNSERIEPSPTRIRAKGEIEAKGKGNSYIIWGRDRPRQRTTGHGGSGDTHANMIDIVVGMQGYAAKDNTYIDPDFQKDAARIYISQKANIDNYFQLNGVNSKATAAIGMYADNVRIAARENIKITTGVGKKNAKGTKIQSVQFGVHLIANNRANELQPIPKGDNLREALVKLANHVGDLNSIVERLLKEQDRFNKALKDHIHFSPFFGMTTSPSPECQLHGQLTVWQHMFISKTDLRLHKTNLNSWRNNYIEKRGKGYINSHYNKVN